MLITRDRKAYLLKDIRLKVCFPFLCVSTVSRVCFVEQLASYAAVGSGMCAGVHGKCLLVWLDIDLNYMEPLNFKTAYHQTS
jgi:hypothetical protein